MYHLIFYQPEIPPNTGNAIRLCANTGSHLHLIHPLGFSLDEKSVRRAGLDYHDLSHVQQYSSWLDFYQQFQSQRIFALSTKAHQSYTDYQYQSGDMFLFGPETRGLPEDIRETLSETLIRIPMQAHNRSLNLSNAAAITLFEACRQCNFPGME